MLYSGPALLLRPRGASTAAIATGLTVTAIVLRAGRRAAALPARDAAPATTPRARTIVVIGIGTTIAIAVTARAAPTLGKLLDYISGGSCPNLRLVLLTGDCSDNSDRDRDSKDDRDERRENGANGDDRKGMNVHLNDELARLRIR